MGFWRLGDGFWKLKLGFGGQVRELAGMWISGQKSGKVFVVLGSGCGELLEWSLGGLERLCSGE